MNFMREVSHPVFLSVRHNGCRIFIGLGNERGRSRVSPDSSVNMLIMKFLLPAVLCLRNRRLE